MRFVDISEEYQVVRGRLPVKGDLVYVASQEAIFKVLHAEGVRVRIERAPEGSGLLLTLPPSQYLIIEKK